MKSTKSACFAFALALVALGAQAQTPPDNGASPDAQQGGRHRGPPPEAIAACQGKSSGATCSFTGRRGDNLTGTCFVPPAPGPGESSGNQNQSTPPMACRPTRGPGGGQSGPPSGSNG